MPCPIVPELILEQVINGLLVGSLYIVLSLGLSLIFSLGGVVNLAHGAFYAVGAYLAYEVEKRLGFFGAVAVSPVAGRAHRHRDRAAVPEPALQQGPGAGPAVHVRAGDGGRAERCA